MRSRTRPTGRRCPASTEDDRWFWGGRLGPPGQADATERDYAADPGYGCQRGDTCPAPGAPQGLHGAGPPDPAAAERRAGRASSPGKGRRCSTRSSTSHSRCCAAARNTRARPGACERRGRGSIPGQLDRDHLRAQFRATGDRLAFGGHGRGRTAVLGRAASQVQGTEAYDITEPQRARSIGGRPA